MEKNDSAISQYETKPAHTKPNKVGPLKVLLVEDNLIVQRIQTTLLSSLNCHTEIAESGEKAVEIFNPGKYDLVFMDIGLPGIQGDAAARLLREAEKNSGHYVPIIALTAHSTAEINQHCMVSGIDLIVNKPLSLEQTKEVLRVFGNS